MTPTPPTPCRELAGIAGLRARDRARRTAKFEGLLFQIATLRGYANEARSYGPKGERIAAKFDLQASQKFETASRLIS